MSNGSETIRKRIPQELLTNLAKEGDQSVVNMLIEMGYRLDTLEGEGRFLSGIQSVAPGLVEDTSRDPMYETPIEEMSVSGDAWGEQLESDAHWAINNLIKDLENEKIQAFVEPYERGLYGTYRQFTEENEIPDVHEAIINALSEKDIEEAKERRKGYPITNVENFDEHYLNTLIHEAFLHGTGGKHSKYGGTWQGWQPQYSGMASRLIDELEGNPALEDMSTELNAIIEVFK